MSKVIDDIKFKGESYKFADKEARERLENVEYQTVTTELAYEHKGLPEGEKIVTVSGDGVFGNNAFVGNFTNLVPSGGFSRTFPYCGITIAKKGDGYVVSGTSTDSAPGFYFTDSNGNYDIPVSAELIGKTLVHAVFADSEQSDIALSAQFLDENKTQISKVSGAVVTRSREVIVPEGTAYIRFQYYSQPNKEYRHEFKFYLIEKESFQTVTLNEGVADIQSISETEIHSVPYKHTASYTVTLRKLIDDYAGGGNVTYITPEDFGAFGDGSTDDSEAIMECINVASQTGKMVIMAGQYFTTSPIIITQSGLEIICNDIVYNGTDCAIKIQGQRNHFKIHSITSNGVGIGFYGNGTKMTTHNNIEVNTITSKSHGIAFYLGSVVIYQNTIRFDLISANGSGCYGICYIDGDGTKNIDENNFYGGQISNCEWAVHNVGGNSRLYGIQIEGNVQGGFCTSKIGGLLIFYPRIGESQRDGNLPMYKFIGTKNVHIYNNLPLAINEIDLSETIDVYQNAAGVKSPEHEGHFGIINGHIMARIPAVGENVEVPTAYCTKAYVWGKFLIMVPHMAYRKEVITSTLDTRLIGRTEETDEEICSLSQLPTKFVVNTINTEIYLHESYCAFGFNEFEVEQANGFTCKIYDKLNNLIFDGTEQGDGLYKLNVYKDSTYCASRTSGLLRRDFTGHYWSVTKETTVDDVLAALPTWSGGAY